MNTDQRTIKRITIISRRAINILFTVPFVLFIGILIIDLLLSVFFHKTIIGSNEYTVHLVLIITFLGGVAASIKGEHIALSSIDERIGPKIKTILTAIRSTVGAAILLSFFCAAFFIFMNNRGVLVVRIPVRLFLVFMPFGFLLMAISQIAENKNNPARILCAVVSVILAVLFSAGIMEKIFYLYKNESPGFISGMSEITFAIAGKMIVPAIIAMIILAFIGMPLFIVLGGIGMILFALDWSTADVIVDEGYKMLTDNALPSIPLFTMTGFLLSESNSGKRLIRLFQAWVGWLPGGSVLLTVLVCAFFTTFTGASGVTILAFGALLLTVLHHSGKYSLSFSRGLITSSGSIGLLFFPSLPIMLYAVVAQINMKHLFIAGLLPGAIMIVSLFAVGIFYSYQRHNKKLKFQFREALEASKDTIFEMLLPVVIIVFYLTGITNLVQTGAVAVIYAAFVIIFIKKDIALKKIPGITIRAMTIIGAVLIILMTAKGLNYFISIIGFPEMLSNLLEQHVTSRFVFLLLLNASLLLAGCFMDIFSAIAVLVPLIKPLGIVYGINPFHLGIIFLSNLGLGYLTPPVGLNLFLASSRFETPLVRIYKDVLPYFLVLLITVIMITYVPAISTLFLPKG